MNKEINQNLTNFLTIKEAIDYSIAKRPNKSAFVIKSNNKNLKQRYSNSNLKFNSEDYLTITFEELKKDVITLAEYFLSKGYKDYKIAVMSKNRYEWVIAYLACIYAGIVVVPLDKTLKTNEIISSLNRVKAKVVVAEKDILKNIYSNSDKLDIHEYILMDETSIFDKEELKEFNFAFKLYDILNNKFEIENNGYSLKDVVIDPEALAILLFTSGTTATSKIVMLSQKNITSNFNAIIQTQNITEKDHTLAFLPYHHAFGSTGQLASLVIGLTTSYCDGLKYIAKNLKEYNCSMFIGVPALVDGIYRNINREIKKQGKEKVFKFIVGFSNLLRKIGIDLRPILFKQIKEKIGGLNIIISGASALDPITHKGLISIGIDTVQGYGLTETSPIIAAEQNGIRKIGTIGKAFPGAEILIDAEDGEIGEILACGDPVMLGYYKNDEANQNAFTEINGKKWFKTGDLGYFDKQGFIHITGRVKNVIVLKNGKNIYPEELEEMINKIPLVEECFVFGLPENDDLKVSVKVKYNENYINEKYPNKTTSEIDEIIWKEIKEVNKLIPTYKYIKKLFTTKLEFEKTSTNKIKRFIEIEKVMNENNY